LIGNTNVNSDNKGATS